MGHSGDDVAGPYIQSAGQVVGECVVPIRKQHIVSVVVVLGVEVTCRQVGDVAAVLVLEGAVEKVIERVTLWLAHAG